jgi:6-phosphogluconate dehydrogenase
MAEIKMLNADIDVLIELYRAEKCLWDSGNAHYLDSDLRQAALNRIASQLGRDVTGGKYAI